MVLNMQCYIYYLLHSSAMYICISHSTLCSYPLYWFLDPWDLLAGSAAAEGCRSLYCFDSLPCGDPDKSQEYVAPFSDVIPFSLCVSPVGIQAGWGGRGTIKKATQCTSDLHHLSSSLSLCLSSYCVSDCSLPSSTSSSSCSSFPSLPAGW